MPSKFGAVIEPPQPNLFVEMAVPIASVTPSWGRTVASLVGRSNSTALTSGTYQPGTIFLCHVLGHKASPTEFLLEIGWSYKPNVTGESRGEVTGISYRGHYFVWEMPKLIVDRAQVKIFQQPEFVIVNQVWPEDDLSTLGIEPP